jgi:hypothetical protein
MGRSTARRMLTGPKLPDPAEQVDGRRLRARRFSDDARALLAHVWALMRMPCGKYLVVMLELWLPPLAADGDLDKPFATEQACAELKAMSAATVDRYLKPARDRMRIMGGGVSPPAQRPKPPPAPADPVRCWPIGCFTRKGADAACLRRGRSGARMSLRTPLCLGRSRRRRKLLYDRRGGCRQESLDRSESAEGERGNVASAGSCGSWAS